MEMKFSTPTDPGIGILRFLTEIALTVWKFLLHHFKNLLESSETSLSGLTEMRVEECLVLIHWLEPSKFP